MTGARSLAFAALAVYAALHWAGLVEPAATGPLLLAVALTTAVFARNMGTVPVFHRRRNMGTVPLFRVAWGLLAVAGGLAATLVLAGVPLRLLVPDEWDALASGIASGVEALPGTRVPYAGSDEWVRTVMVGGGVLLIGCGGLLALRGGRPLAGAVALGVLYAVPVVERDPSVPYLDGAVFAVLAAALVWADRVRREELALAGALLAGVTATGMLVAPRVDASRPWLDYEQLVEDLEAQRTSSFTWDHDYGPLDWTREGREVLRVRSPRPAYWKAVALEQFDGLRWSRARGADSGAQDTEVLRDSWRSDLRFEVRALRTRQVIGAGTTIRIRGARPLVAEATPGTFETVRSPLRRGDEYVARSYVPRPTAQRMREAGTDYPAFVRRQLTIGVPAPAQPGGRPLTVALPAWGADAPAFTFRPGLPSTDGVEVLRSSPYRRMYDLARRQRAASATPYDFARRVSAFLQRDAVYTERPREAAVPLDAFVFERREGYCQQFSGAMALLLRMGGVPARVASGFSPGGFDEETNTWIVRDLDAHSWVEVYFPRIGWVAFDPTPAAAPAGGRAEERAAQAGAQSDVLGDDPLGRGQAADGGAAGVDDAPGPSRRGPLLAAAAVLLCGLLAGVALHRRRRAVPDDLPGELAEVRRALEGTGRDPQRGLTLQRVERALGRGPAADYLRALGHRRYGTSAADLDPLGRAALRRELAEGLDVGARMRAWRALRPGRAELLARLHRRR